MFLAYDDDVVVHEVRVRGDGESEKGSATYVLLDWGVNAKRCVV